MQYPDLAGKVAVITGAGRKEGLGAAMARRLASEGCKVLLADIGRAEGAQMPQEAVGTGEELEAVAADITAAGGEVATCACNVLDEREVNNMVQRAVDTFGGVDILINNAGIGYLMKPVVDMSTDEWDAVLGVNLRGVFLCSRAAARQMIDRGKGGCIINIASQAAKSAFPFASAYCSSKHGLVGLTRVCAIEMGQHGIRVNAICPNHVTTGLGAWQNQYFSEATGRSLEQYMQDMRERIPLGRPGEQQDTAKLCAFLASEQSAYMTGEAVNVSGGEEYH